MIGKTAVTLFTALLMVSTTACAKGPAEGGTSTRPTPVPSSFTVSPMSATFDQSKYSTTYQVAYSNPNGEKLTFEWLGPN